MGNLSNSDVGNIIIFAGWTHASHRVSVFLVFGLYLLLPGHIV